jgi:hypothetical protein
MKKVMISRKKNVCKYDSVLLDIDHEDIQLLLMYKIISTWKINLIKIGSKNSVW